MKKTSWFMKLLLVLPIILLIVLMVWMIGDKVKQGNENNQDAQTESSLVVQTEDTAASSLETESEGIVIDSDETEVAEEPVEEAPRPEVNLLFAGDVMLSPEHVLKAYDAAGGIHGVLDEEIRQVIDQADIFMVNEEFPFSERGSKAPDKQYTYRLPPARVSIMNEMGIDIVTLANNHALDYGNDALLDTCAILDEAGIKRVGAGANLEEAKKPEFIEVGDKVIGFLGASRKIPVHTWTAGKNAPGMLTTYDPAILLDEIVKTKEQCDYLVVYVHWGTERAENPDDYQHTLGQQYIDAGADLVVGSHPHVLQGIEYYNGKPIIHSLGNFVFGSSIPKTALLKVKLTEDGLSLSLVPCTSSKGYTQTIKDEGSIQEFYQYMTGLSFGAVVGADGSVTPMP